MHPNNRCVDHLHRRIMSGGQRVHDAAPDASPPPANEAVVASGRRTEVIRQVAPWCSGSQDPEDAIKDTPVVHPRHATRLVRQHRFDGGPFMVGEFVAHDDSRLRFGSLNHVPGDAINPQRPIAADANTLISLPLLGAQRTWRAQLLAPVRSRMTRYMVRPCVASGFRRAGGERSCINVSGLTVERFVLRAIMDISARAISLAERPQ